MYVRLGLELGLLRGAFGPERPLDSVISLDRSDERTKVTTRSRISP
jgi:hypothetical protein